MKWSRLGVIRSLIPSKAEAGEISRRWRNARLAQPELAEDVAGFGGLTQLQPAIFDGGVATPQLDALRLAYEAGRRDMALHQLALMGVSQTELNSMMMES